MRFIFPLLIFLTISLSSFELILNLFHSPFGQEVVNPQAHNLTWLYLLKQKYITLIELDIFTIHEKRHLLDVKRLFEQIYSLWIFFPFRFIGILRPLEGGLGPFWSLPLNSGGFNPGILPLFL